MPPTSAYPPDRFSFKEKLQYSLLGMIVIGGSFFIGRSLIRKAVATSEQKKTFEQGNPAAYAQQMRMAFENDGWPGTDVAALREAIQAVPSVAEFKKIITSYQRLYNRSLMLDMKSHLKTTVYNEMLAILAAKPAKGSMQTPQQLSLAQFQSWAQRLKSAFDMTYGIFPGTDEKAIRAVFMEIPSQTAYRQLAAVYKTLYGNELDTDLRSELELWEYPSYMKIITDKP
jgi:hypothetical protein